MPMTMTPAQRANRLLREEPEQLAPAIQHEIEDALAELLSVVGVEVTCPRCGMTVWWVKRPAGQSRITPYTRSGLNHLIDCPQSEGQRRRKDRSRTLAEVFASEGEQ